MNGILPGSRFRTLTTSQPTIAFDSGNVKSVELDKTFLGKTISLRLSGSTTVTVATTLAGDELPLELLKKIEVVADGRVYLVTGSGRDLYRLAHFQRGKEGERLAPGTTVAVHPFSATILIDLEAARMVKPLDSFFDGRSFERIELRVTWGTIADLYATGTATVDSTTKVDVAYLQTTQGFDQVAFRRMHTYDIIPATTTTEITRRIQRSGLLAHILLGSRNGRTTDDTIIQKVSLKVESNFFNVAKLDWAHLQRRNVQEYQLDGPAVTVGKVQGYAMVDLTEDGMIQSALNTLNLNNIDLVLEVTGGAAFQVFASYIFYDPITPLGLAMAA